MVAAGIAKIKSLIDLKANVNSNIADIAGPKVVRTQVLDNRGRECGDFALPRKQH
jgi:hypothetical protein